MATSDASILFRTPPALIKDIISNVPDFDEKQVEAKSEAIMAFIEGMIVRAEFDDITLYRPIYRLVIQTLGKKF